jgi:hypothetical protein
VQGELDSGLGKTRLVIVSIPLLCSLAERSGTNPHRHYPGSEEHTSGTRAGKPKEKQNPSGSPEGRGALVPLSKRKRVLRPFGALDISPIAL